MTEYEGFVCAPGDVGKIAIIVSRFNKTITDNLLEGALNKLRENMVSDEQITVVRVPGAFEIPTLAQRFAADSDYAAVICLGCVIKGETPHDEYINSAVSREIARIGAEYCLPVIFGLLTCNTIDQALARSGSAEIGKDKTLGEQPGNKGAEAAEAALEMIDLFGKLPELYDPESDEEEFSSLRDNSDRYVRGDFESVDVDPDALEEIDEDDDEDKSWFVPGGFKSEKVTERRLDNKKRNDRDDRRLNKRHNSHDGKKGAGNFKTSKSGNHDKKYKKDGEKKNHK